MNKRINERIGDWKKWVMNEITNIELSKRDELMIIIVIVIWH